MWNKDKNGDQIQSPDESLGFQVDQMFLESRRASQVLVPSQTESRDCRTSGRFLELLNNNARGSVESSQILLLSLRVRINWGASR